MLVLVALLWAVLPGLGAGLAAAQDIRFFRIGTGTTGGTYFPIGGVIANGISNPPGSRPCERGGSCGVPGLIAVAQATEGSVENISLMTRGTLESALVQADIAYWAHTGTGPYKGRPPALELRTIASLYAEAVHLVVRADGPIRTVSDLKGKTVSVGEEGSGTLVDARLVMQAYGVAEKQLKARYLRPGPAADELAEGRIDAFFLVAGPPAAAIADLAQRIPIRLVPISEKPADELLAKQPFLVSSTVPEGTYEGVAATPTVAVSAQWIVRADVSDEVVYGLTKALWHPNMARLLSNGHPKGRQIMIAGATAGLGVPLHPGAERYYREAGIPMDTDSAVPAGPGEPPPAKP
ncbi:TAXI family TRAP transporter solute-binding subunit [Arenibaculum pallidiluteum]|uniref:TAXI family TRAP transporter solute-binding subunit n=1 Tax=Arenibaculum pallidiluteum TaxID=2812559 RepID=UPI002E2DB3C1|nr:TAXI family TRAP transporter solute-binding subunit [Arenibaculum pallidiluteum]